MFWERFSELCNKNNTTANAVCAKLGKSTAAATHWKNGSIPKGDILTEIADYFDCSVDYLLGRTNVSEVNKSTTQENILQKFREAGKSSAQIAAYGKSVSNIKKIKRD